jgi:hypothetical protein
MLGLRLYDVVFWTEQLVLEEEGGVGGCASSPRLKLRNELEHNHFMVVSSARLLDEEEKRREEKRREEKRREEKRREEKRREEKRREEKRREEKRRDKEGCTSP